MVSRGSVPFGNGQTDGVKISTVQHSNPKASNVNYNIWSKILLYCTAHEAGVDYFMRL